MLLADFKDAVATGNGEYLSVIRKQLLLHFFSTPGFSEFAIEMFVNILQCQVLLSEMEAYNCKWAATVNWKGGAGNNIEIDLFQENRNCEIKKLITAMGEQTRQKRQLGGQVIFMFSKNAIIIQISPTSLKSAINIVLDVSQLCIRVDWTP